MVNKCLAVGCRNGNVSTRKIGPPTSAFCLPWSHPDLVPYWVKFLNRPDFKPDPKSTSQVICADHFEEKYLKRGNKRVHLDFSLNPVPTIQAASASGKHSCLPNIVVPRKKPAERPYQIDEKSSFDKADAIRSLGDLDASRGPKGWQFSQGNDHVVYFNLQYDESGFPHIFESIRVDSQLHVQLQFNGNPVPLPKFFTIGSNAKLTSAGALTNFPAYMRNLTEEERYPFLEELNLRKNYEPKGRPPYSAAMIRYALLLRHTSLQSYRMLLDQFPLPSLSLLAKIQKGGVDALKSCKLLREKGDISEDVILMLDEMYLQKSTQYHGGEYIGSNEDGDLYKGVVVLMIVGLKKSVPYVVKTCPETNVSGDLIASEIWEAIGNLAKAGFNVRGVVVDNHSSNVSGFSKLVNSYSNGRDALFIHHPDNKSKTYLFYDNVHLVKNIRNNLLQAKTFSFPAFSIRLNQTLYESPDGYISWGDLHAIFDRDSKLQANLRKAPKLSYRVLHPGNNKQSVNLALAIFHETTIAAIRSYLPEKKGMAEILESFSAWWTITNCNTRFHTSNPLGNGIIGGDGKTDFMRSMAEFISTWCNGEHGFCLTTRTSNALQRTLRAQADLIDDLLNEGYDFVLPRKLQSDPLEKRFSQYRQMSGGRFLVSLCEVNNSERILACRSLLKKDVNFWEEDVRTNTEYADELTRLDLAIEEDISHLSEATLSKDSEEVATFIAGYVGKKLTKRTDCRECKSLLVSEDADSFENEYFKILSRGGLFVPSPSLAEFTCSGFAVLDICDAKIAKFPIIPTRTCAEHILRQFLTSDGFVCTNHSSWVMQFALKIIVNIFFNNKQKEIADSVRKDLVKVFKKRQLEK